MRFLSIISFMLLMSGNIQAQEMEKDEIILNQMAQEIKAKLECGCEQLQSEKWDSVAIKFYVDTAQINRLLHKKLDFDFTTGFCL